jgi:hypothetical protein
MEKITTVGLDLAKQVMAVHAVEADEKMVMRKVLRRDQLLRWTTACLQPAEVNGALTLSGGISLCFIRLTEFLAHRA